MKIVKTSQARITVNQLLAMLLPKMKANPKQVWEAFTADLKAIPEIKNAMVEIWADLIKGNDSMFDDCPSDLREDQRIITAHESNIEQIPVTNTPEVTPEVSTPVEPEEPLMTLVPKTNISDDWTSNKQLDKVNAAKKTLVSLIKQYSTTPSMKKRFNVQEDPDNRGSYTVSNEDGESVFYGDVFGTLKALRQVVSKQTIDESMQTGKEDGQESLITQRKKPVLKSPELGMSEEEFAQMSGKNYVPRIQDKLKTMRDEDEG